MQSTQTNREWFREKISTNFYYSALRNTPFSVAICSVLRDFETYVLDKTSKWKEHSYCADFLAENYLITILEFACASRDKHKELGVYVTEPEFEIIKSRICNNTGEKTLSGNYNEVLDSDFISYTPRMIGKILGVDNASILEDEEVSAITRFIERMEVVTKNTDDKLNNELVMPVLPKEAYPISFSDIYENDEYGNPTGSDFKYCHPDVDEGFNAYLIARSMKNNLIFSSICRKKVNWEVDDNYNRLSLGLFYESTMMFNMFTSISHCLVSLIYGSPKFTLDTIKTFLETERMNKLDTYDVTPEKIVYNLLTEYDKWHKKGEIEVPFNKTIDAIFAPLLEVHNWNKQADNLFGDYESHFNSFCNACQFPV